MNIYTGTTVIRPVRSVLDVGVYVDSELTWWLRCPTDN